MPWRKKAMKDVISCDKLREAANGLHDPEISEWETQPMLNIELRSSEYIG